MDNELSACKHSKVSTTVFYQMGAQGPLLSGCQMSGLLYLKNHYSVILMSRFHLPEKYMGPYHCPFYLLGSDQQLTEAESLCPESHKMPLHSSAKPIWLEKKMASSMHGWARSGQM